MSASSLSDLENNPAAVTFARREAAVCLWIHTIIERAKSGWPASNAFPLPAEKLPPAPIASLSALVDGIALCSALTWIKPRSVPKVHLNTDSSFGGRENLSFALTAMEEMGISKWDLFSVPDLQNLQNPAKVVDSLEILALFLEAPLVLKAGKEVLSSEIRSNPLPRLETLSAASGRLPPAELFRRSILSLDVARYLPLVKSGSVASSRTIRALAAGSAPRICSTSTAAPNFRRFTITKKPAGLPSPSGPYGGPGGAPPPTAPRLRRPPPTHKEHAAARVIQKTVRGYLARRLYQFMRRANAFRTKVAQEILETEKAYIAGLETIEICYSAPLGKTNIVAEEWQRRLFADLSVIVGYSKQLLRLLTQRLDCWEQSQNHQCMGDIFVKQSAFFRVYTQYCNTYTDRISALEDEKDKNKKLVEFLAQADNHPGVAGKNLAAFLIMPIQRVPRYEMLLKELLKHTWQDHPDFEQLNLAFEKVREAAVYINDRRREAENIRRVLQIQDSFIGKGHNFAAPHRRFVLESDVNLADDPDPAGPMPFHVFLFNDLLIVTKPKGKRKFALKQTLELNSWALSSDIFARGRALKLLHHSDSLPPVLLLFQKSGDCVLWLKQLRKLQQRLSSNIPSEASFPSPTPSPTPSSLASPFSGSHPSGSSPIPRTASPSPFTTSSSSQPASPSIPNLSLGVVLSLEKDGGKRPLSARGVDDKTKEKIKEKTKEKTKKKFGLGSLTPRLGKKG